MSVRSTVLAAGQYIGRWASWVEQNKAGLAACGSAIGAIYNGIVNGADAMTLALAVGTLIGLATHLSSTPLSNPKTAQGVPLIPATPAVTLQLVSEHGPETASLPAGADRLSLLPPPHPSGKRTGALITRDHRDYTPDRLTSKPKDVSAVWRQTKNWPLLLNATLGDCTIAGLLHLLTILTAIAGRPAPAWSDADALRLYEQWAGYRPGVKSTDTGADPRQILLDAQKIGVDGLKIGSFASVPTASLTAIKAALRAHGALYSALYLPDDYDRMGFRWIVQRSYRPDPNEGHAVVVVMFAGRFYAITWGGLATVSEGFLLEYFVQHFAVEGLTA